MKSFIEEVLEKVLSQYGQLNDLTFVLPSKRAGTFLKMAIAQRSTKTILSPKILSVEDFIEQLSGLTYSSQNQLLFLLYESYLETGTYEKESFDAFLKWAPTLLQDFNEVDRYLVNAESLYTNLSAIQEIQHWSLEKEQTTLMKNYLAFWNHTYPLYKAFNTTLLKKGMGHQGLVYRKAHEHLMDATSELKPHIFLGFNALNTAEEQIIEYILQHSNSQIYWDLDPYFLEDDVHDAGHFIRRHLHTWCPKEKAPTMENHHYLEKKHIEIIGVPQQVSQAKQVSVILNALYSEHAQVPEDIALILGDETLLGPVLNALPSQIPAINITMGQPLHAVPVANFMLQFLEVVSLHTKKGWYHKDLLQFLNHPICHGFQTKAKFTVRHLSAHIAKRNIIYVTDPLLLEMNNGEHPIINCLLRANNTMAVEVVQICQDLVHLLKETGSQEGNDLLLEQLFRLSTLFNSLQDLLQQYTFANDLNTLKVLFKELLSSETLDFEGDPLEGLQIMGMLESRNLDFGTVVLTSVNEGILPSGKTQNSFIPFDLKQKFGLPTYKEKDAVYTYHFYRLLQRASKVFLLYNTEPDTLEGGEKSRLIRQLLTDHNRQDIVEKIASPFLNPGHRHPATIKKTPHLSSLIKERAQKGFSPSSLGNYIRNPMDFYKQQLLGIQETPLVEEVMAANTFGTIVHDALEELYTPLIGKKLTPALLTKVKENVKPVVEGQFEKHHSSAQQTTGKNHISFHVILKYIDNFINLEIKDVQQNTVTLLGLEQSLRFEIRHPSLPYTVFLKGKLDRVDRYNGTLRILDYKTGKVERSHLEITYWPSLIEEDRYTKAFQLLCYAYLFQKLNDEPVLWAGIISFKNLGEGIMHFAQKSSSHSKIKDHSITTDTLNQFESELLNLIQEICDPDIPFTEKEN